MEGIIVGFALVAAYYAEYSVGLRLVWGLHLRGNHRSAIWLLNRMMLLHPFKAYRSTLLAYRSVIKCNYYHDYSDAIEDASHAIRLDKKNALAFNNRGYAYYHLGDIDNAMKDFDQALELQPKFVLPYTNLGVIFYRRYRDHKAAVDQFEHAIRCAPKSFEAWHTLIFIMTEMGDFEGALQALQIAKEKEIYSAFIHILRALILQQQYSFERSQDDIKHALHIKPEDSNILRVLIDIYFFEQKFDKSIDIFNLLINKNPRNEELYISRGLTYHRSHQIDKAMQDYERAMEINPYSGNPYRARAVIYTHQGRYTEALDDVHISIEREPANKSNFSIRGEIYFVQGNYDSALQDFATAEKLRVSDEFALAGQAVTHYKLGDRELAKQLWQEVIKQEPKYEDLDHFKVELLASNIFMETLREVAELM